MSILTFLFAGYLLAAPGALAVETKDPCFISILEQERLTEFFRLKEFLVQNVFGRWEKEVPPIFMYDEKCQFVLNQTEIGPEGFSKSEQVLNIPALSTTVVYFKLNRMKAPFGDEIAVKIPPVRKTVVDPKGRAWTVMAQYPVWKAEYHERIEDYFADFAHELFHPYQYKFPKIKAVMAAVSEDDFTKFYMENGAFQVLVEKEAVALNAAISASKQSAKKKAIKQFFEARRKRRQNFFTGPRVNWSLYEPGMEAIEGVAEYMNFRLMTDAKKIPSNRKLKEMDPEYKGFAHYKTMGSRQILSSIMKTKSYTQKLGVLQIILLNQLLPNWQSRIFEEDRFAESILQNELL